MRYYYDDPLQAAYMVREFGLRLFGYDDEEEDEPMSVGYEWLAKQVLYPFKDGYGNSHMIVHPDSYEILKPQVGDLIHSSDNEWFAPIERIETYYTYSVAKYGEDYNHNYDDTKEKCDARTEEDKDVLVLHAEYEPDPAFWEWGDKSVKIIQRQGKAFFTPLEMD